jgi:hypothetical protein
LDSVKWLSQDIHVKELERDLPLSFYVGGNSSAVTAQRWVFEKFQLPLMGAWASILYVLEKEIVPM